MPLEFEDRPAIGDGDSEAPTARAVGRQVLIAGGVLMVIFCALWILAAPLGVWLPDVVFQTTKALAKTSSRNGHHFQVVQYWNNGDFYSTELWHTRPDGTREIHTLDGDDFKEWSVPLVLDEAGRTATVTLLGRPPKVISWQ